jgi:hypothetical protein
MVMYNYGLTPDSVRAGSMEIMHAASSMLWICDPSHPLVVFPPGVLDFSPI